jgi:hypothetical protein
MSERTPKARSESTSSSGSDASPGPKVQLYGQTDFTPVVEKYQLKQALIKGLAERRKALGKNGGKTRRRHKKTQKRKHHRKTSHRRK